MKAQVDPTDILAIVLMAVFSMRRMEVRATDLRALPGVSPEGFAAWKAAAERARSISIHACFAKFALNSVWFYGFSSRVPLPVLSTGGWLLFIGWVGAMMYGWWRYSESKALADRLGVVIGRRLVEVPGGEGGDDDDEGPASPRGSAASGPSD